MRELVLIVHNIRSTHNVGSLMRTSDGLGVLEIYLTGYTPYPKEADDARLPHLADKITRQISKTALGAEQTISWQHSEDVFNVISSLRSEGYQMLALEQTAEAVDLPLFKAEEKVALIVGREVEGIEPEVLAEADAHIEIKMRGKKESFNVAVAAAIALYNLSMS